MMRIFCLFLITLFSLSSPAQTNSKIKELQTKRMQLQKEISKKEHLLTTNQKTVKAQLHTIGTLNGQIEERKYYIAGIASDVQIINKEADTLNSHLGQLNEQLQLRKTKYAKSLQNMYRVKSMHEKLTFLFSASTFRQAYRRLRYLKDYAGYQRVLAANIMQQQAKIKLKQNELNEVRQAKHVLLNEHEQQRKKLEAQEAQKQEIVGQLQKEQKGLRVEIGKTRKVASRLNAEIDRQVSIEIEKARIGAVEAARKRALAEKKARVAAEAAAAAREAAREAAEKKANANNTSVSSGKLAERERPKRETIVSKKKAEPMLAFSSNEDQKLSGGFSSNRGRLPIPITGTYLIVNRYGEYNVAGMHGVRLDSKGVNIQGQPGAQARSIFEGEVASVFQVNGLSNVIVRHGSYLSVYCNLSSVNVRQGQKVSARQSLGHIFSDPNDGGRTVLHFQLRNEKTKLNPEQWLGR